MAQAQVQRPQLALIRFAMAAGVILFGGVIVFLHRGGTWVIHPQPPVMGYAQIGVSIGAVLIASSMRSRPVRETDEAKRNSILVPGWALGEGAALFGAVLFLLSGDWQPYVIGLLAMFISFVLLPIRKQA